MVADLETQLQTLLQNNWSLPSNLQTVSYGVSQDNAVIKCHRSKRRIEGSVDDYNLIFYEVRSVDVWTNEGMADCRAVVTVEIRLPCKSTTNEDVENAKADKLAIREEIYRILEQTSKIANTITRPVGWEWAYPTMRDNKDNFDAPKPWLGEEIQVTIAYQRTVT